MHPFQPYLLKTSPDFEGYLLQFTYDFFCIYRHNSEIGCNGILFNDPYHSPLIELTKLQASEMLPTLLAMEKEVAQNEAGRDDCLKSLLRVLLIYATRIKKTSLPETALSPARAARCD